MPKNNRHGQAAVLSDQQLDRVRKQLKSRHHRLIFDIARFTGERAGAIVQLQTRDCYHDNRQPRDTITFRAQTRKARPGGRRETREVPVSDRLHEKLSAYSPPAHSLYLFPGEVGHISFSAFDKALRRAIAKAKMEHLGASTHSFRRSAATKIGQVFDTKLYKSLWGGKILEMPFATKR
ncbi:tyrosine-type recombinase/integrase [Almyronema epifaneia]|uniref:Tyrosine-type recombinase/integrase n=1 Tax=Almyronema epifaneia S1 TaxID=2991925 RepID=A0ABW6I9H3_9CYAN